ncbi:hypothetical protein V6N13_062974 [Hibiscus sabdariffa]
MSYSSEDLSSFLSSSVRVLPSNVSATGSNTNEETDGVANARELTPSVTETVPLVQQSVPICGVIPEADTVPEEAVVPAIHEIAPVVNDCAPSIHEEAVVPTIHEESVDHSSPVCTDVPEVESIPVEAVVPAEVPQAVASSSGAERLFDGCVDASQTDGSNDNALESDYNTLVPPGPTNTHSMVTRSKEILYVFFSLSRPLLGKSIEKLGFRLSRFSGSPSGIEVWERGNQERSCS